MTINYTVCCSAKNCGNTAVYKIAAHWTDGLTEELKTYGFSCDGCLPDVWHQSREKQLRCRLGEGEILAQPGIFKLEPNKHDKKLKRLEELERKLSR